MLTPRALATLNGFNSRQLHRITGRSYRDEATKPSYDLLTAVRTRRYHWLGHILRMPADRLVRRAVLALGQRAGPPYQPGSLLMDTPLPLKPGVHTNDFAPIPRLRALKLGHASLATVLRPGRLTLQPILRENLESPVLRYQPITTAVVTDAYLNTRWHHGAYTSAVLRESLGLDRVVTVYVA